MELLHLVSFLESKGSRMLNEEYEMTDQKGKFYQFEGASKIISLSFSRMDSR